MLSKSNVIYQFTCADCGNSYIGKTKRTLSESKKEHLAAIKKTTNKSSIAEHIIKNDHTTSFDTFRIIDTADNNYALLIKESLNIYSKKPAINDMNHFQLSLY